MAASNPTSDDGQAKSSQEEGCLKALILDLLKTLHLLCQDRVSCWDKQKRADENIQTKMDKIKNLLLRFQMKLEEREGELLKKDEACKSMLEENCVFKKRCAKLEADLNLVRDQNVSLLKSGDVFRVKFDELTNLSSKMNNKIKFNESEMNAMREQILYLTQASNSYEAEKKYREEEFVTLRNEKYGLINEIARLKSLPRGIGPSRGDMSSSSLSPVVNGTNRSKPSSLLLSQQSSSSERQPSNTLLHLFPSTNTNDQVDSFSSDEVNNNNDDGGQADNFDGGRSMDDNDLPTMNPPSPSNPTQEDMICPYCQHQSFNFDKHLEHTSYCCN